jgi:hypothetical protein
MTTGPPPNITVLARYMFAKRLRAKRGSETLALETSMAIKDTAGSGLAHVHRHLESTMGHTKEENKNHNPNMNTNHVGPVTGLPFLLKPGY